MTEVKINGRKEESSDSTKFCRGFFNQLKKPGTS